LLFPVWISIRPQEVSTGNLVVQAGFFETDVFVKSFGGFRLQVSGGDVCCACQQARR